MGDPCDTRTTHNIIALLCRRRAAVRGEVLPQCHARGRTPPHYRPNANLILLQRDKRRVGINTFVLICQRVCPFLIRLEIWVLFCFIKF